MQLPGITKPGVYIRDDRLYVVWYGRFGKQQHCHIAYVEADGAIVFCKPNEGLRIPIGRVKNKHITIDLS